jgi:16S rRNA (guanine527-N7)-methyltransferase
MIPNSQMKSILLSYGVTATCELCEAIRTYISVLLLWNRKMSLTAVTDVAEIVRFHFGESMLAVSAIGIVNGRLADVGTGAGFPGVPIRMICPKLDVVLIESSTKKAAFLAEVSRQLQLDVEIFRGRSEEMPAATEKFDFVASRAVGGLEKLLPWAESHLQPGGSVIFWTTAASGVQRIGAGSAFSWGHPKKIPNSSERVLLSGTVRSRST